VVFNTKIRRQLLYMSTDPLRQYGEFGVTLYARHVLLKYMFALHISNFLLIFLYLFMLYARLAFIILITGLCILLRLYQSIYI
jgi:hypothetical protein